ncbi:MAG: pirin family protein [Pseudomonadota bacterium]
MTVMVRRASERGKRTLDWFESKFTFSFDDYYDPRYLGFGALRALNETTVAAKGVFDPVTRSDLELVTYVCEGELLHKDSLGNDVVLGAGDVQCISAGSGIEHSSGNASGDAALRYVQIWILPEHDGGPPRYQNVRFPAGADSRGMRLLGSRDGGNGSLKVGRDVDLHLGALQAGDSVAHPLGPDREAWLQVLSGRITVNSELLDAGDGAGFVGDAVLRVDPIGSADILLFDMSRD